jgi:hypothetical protein
VVTLTASPNPANNGTLVTLTARPAVTGATGTIQFIDGGAVLGTIAVNASGAAVLTTSTLSVATHTIVAVYSGDATHSAGTSAPVSLVINPILL